MKKKLLAMLLSLTMCASLVPTVALAADDTATYNYESVSWNSGWTDANGDKITGVGTGDYVEFVNIGANTGGYRASWESAFTNSSCNTQSDPITFNHGEGTTNTFSITYTADDVTTVVNDYELTYSGTDSYAPPETVDLLHLCFTEKYGKGDIVITVSDLEINETPINDTFTVENGSNDYFVYLDAEDMHYPLTVTGTFNVMSPDADGYSGNYTPASATLLRFSLGQTYDYYVKDTDGAGHYLKEADLNSFAGDMAYCKNVHTGTYYVTPDMDITDTFDVVSALESATIILGAGDHGDITFPTGATSSVTQNITFIGEDGAAVGILKPTPHNDSAVRGDVVIENLVINGTVDMQKSKSTSLTITECTFTATQELGSSYWTLLMDPSMQGGSIGTFTFTDNAVAPVSRGIVSASSDVVTISGNTFLGSESAVVEIWSANETVTIENNTFEDGYVSVSSGVVDLAITGNSFASEEDAYAIYLNQGFAYDKTTSPWTYDFTATENEAYASIDISDNTYTGYENPFFIGFGYAFANPEMDFEDAVLYISHTHYTSTAELTKGEITAEDEAAFITALQTAMNNDAVAVAHINTTIVVTEGQTLTIPEGLEVVFGTSGSLTTSGTGTIINKNDVSDTTVDVPVNPSTDTTTDENNNVTTSTTVDSAPTVDSALGSVNVTVDATASDDAVTKAEITFTETATASLAAADTTTIKTDVAQVVFSSEAMSSIDDATDTNVEVKLVVEAVEAEALTDEQQAKIPADVTATIVDLSLIKVVEGVEDDTVTFNGTVTVTMPYTHEEGKTPVVYYVAEDGSLSKMNVVSYTDDTVTFTTTHFSHYMSYATTVSSGGTSYYSSSVASTSNGSVSISASRSTMNSTVTITATPDSGYAVGDVTVAYSSGKTVSVTANSNGTYSYLQPGASVTVTVTFVESDDADDAVELPFTDVADDAWFLDGAVYVYENGLMNGTTATTFSPDMDMSRAMFVTVLARIADADVEDLEPTFEDVSVLSFYAPYIAWAELLGIADGDAFRPDDSITREEMAVMLYRMAEAFDVALEAVNDAVTFLDEDDISEDALEAVAAMQQAGILNGNNDGTFEPLDTATRAEVCIMLARFAAL